jgi:magnesium transporter
MPELGWPFGYLAVLGLMVLLMLGMLVYFKRRRWF